MPKIINNLGCDQQPGLSLRMRIPVDATEAPAFAWSCDGKRLAMTSYLGSDVWEVDTDAWEFRHAISIGRNISIRRNIRVGSSRFVMWSPTDPDVLVQARGDTMTLLRIDENGRRCVPAWRAKYVADFGLRAAISFSPAGDRIAVAGGSPGISIIDASTGAIVHTRPTHSPVNEVRWSPDGSRILASDDSSEAVIYPLSGRSTGRALLGSQEQIHWAAWSPDATLLCACSTQRTILVWDAAGHLRTVLEGHTGKVTCAEFSHDGRLLYSISTDRTLRCWRTDTWQCVATIDTGSKHFDTGTFYPGGKPVDIGGLAVNPVCSVLARHPMTLFVKRQLFDLVCGVPRRCVRRRWCRF